MIQQPNYDVIVETQIALIEVEMGPYGRVKQCVEKDECAVFNLQKPINAHQPSMHKNV